MGSTTPLHSLTLYNDYYSSNHPTPSEQHFMRVDDEVIPIYRYCVVCGCDLFIYAPVRNGEHILSIFKEKRVRDVSFFIANKKVSDATIAQRLHTIQAFAEVTQDLIGCFLIDYKQYTEGN